MPCQVKKCHCNSTPSQLHACQKPSRLTQVRHAGQVKKCQSTSTHTPAKEYAQGRIAPEAPGRKHKPSESEVAKTPVHSASTSQVKVRWQEKRQFTRKPSEESAKAQGPPRTPASKPSEESAKAPQAPTHKAPSKPSEEKCQSKPQASQVKQVPKHPKARKATSKPSGAGAKAPKRQHGPSKPSEERAKAPEGAHTRQATQAKPSEESAKSGGTRPSKPTRHPSRQASASSPLNFTSKGAVGGEK
eukprot:1389684-Amphidinium_carterae.1